VRYAEYLRQRYKAILGYTGLLNLIVSLLILSPLALLIVYQDEVSQAWGFLLPGLVLALPSLWLWRRLTPRPPVSLTMQEGAVIVVLTWLLAILVGMIPFAAISRLNFTQALFESTSAWTTAGLSVLDVSHASRLILFYRSVLQLAGGAGLAIIMLSALAGPVGPGLTIAEGRSEQLLPHVRRSARLVLTIYAAYVIVGILALALAGMSWFDSVNHAFTALSTGGFSTRAESIAYWQDPAIEGVIIVLMLLGTLNFLTAYMLFRGKARAAARNSEVRQTGLLLLIGAVILFFGVTRGLYPALGESLRTAVFNVVSALSTTGFATVDYRQWNGLGLLILILFMLIGGGTGSTAGGIKQHRIYVLYKGLVWEFRRRLLPQSAVSEPDIWRGEQRHFISDRQLRQIAMFVFLYLVVFFVCAGLIAAHGYSLQDSLFESASALSTVGISVGITASNAPAGVLWVETVAMFLGRLEFFTIVIGLIRLLNDVPAILSSSFNTRSPASPGRRTAGKGLRQTGDVPQVPDLPSKAQDPPLGEGAQTDGPQPDDQPQDSEPPAVPSKRQEA
jgi:trk system potassium uptake protein TrkH